MAQVRRRRSYKSKTAVAGQSFRDYLVMAVVTAVVVIVVVLFIRMRAGGTNPVGNAFSSTSTYLNGVVINGIELGGMSYEDGVAAVTEQMQQRLSAPINVVYGEKVFTITPSELDARLPGVDDYLSRAWSFGHFGNADDINRQIEEVNSGKAVFTCQLVYDEEKLDDFVDSIATRVNKQYVNATLEVDASELLTIVKHQDGLQVDQADLKAQIVSALEAGGSANITLVPAIWKPQYTTQDMSECRELIAQFKTDARTSNENRTKNIIRALEPFAQMIVMPGETISFNEKVGKRRIENGFYIAPEYVDGLLTDGVGGGTCQASTTLYVALVRAGFEIQQRTQHSRMVGYCKPSQDSTVTDSGVVRDLVFTNRTEYPMYIFAEANNMEAMVRIYGRKPQYKIKFVTRTVEENIMWKGETYEKDTAHKFVKKPGDGPILKKEGTPGCVTEGWVEYYDWNTGELVDKARLSRDTYEPVKPVYYVWADD